ncbi:transglycosylase SLT domain-containing protein [Streptomyces sp. NPDC101227]|uniref:transglycosylase SLT domain-containing protein n=1 Tax=Streptomyces sp. NPDC101227 TaxID=3366136 RepID=UPI0037F4BF65
MATTTSLGFTIFSRWHGDGVMRARRDINQLDNQLRRTNRSVAENGQAMKNLAAGAALVAPAMGTIGTASVGAAAGVAAVGVAAGAAGGLFVAMATTAVREWKKMGSAGRAFHSQVEGLQRVWLNFVITNRKFSLQPMIDMMAGARVAIGKLQPVVNALGPSVVKLGQAVRKWLSDAGMDRFVATVVKYGVPAVKQLGTAGRNLAAVGGIIFRVFAPLGLQLTQSFTRLTVAMRKWAEGGGVTRFLSSVRSMGPQVAQFFKALGAALINVANAMRSMAPLSLVVATGFLRIVAVLPPPAIQAITYAFIAWRVAMTAAAVHAAIFATTLSILRGRTVAQTVALVAQRVAILAVRGAILVWTAAQWLLNVALTANPIGVIIVAIGALVAAIVWVATKTRFFQNTWNVVWNAIKVAFNAVVNFLHGKWAWLVAFLGPVGWLLLLLTHWKTVWNAVKNAFVAVVNAIRRAASAFWNAMKSTFRTSLNAISAAWRAAWNLTSRTVQAVWNAVRRAAGAFLNALRAAFRGGMNALGSAWRAAWNSVSRIASSIWNALKSAAKTFASALLATFKSAVSAIGKAWDGLRTLFKKPISFLINTVINGGAIKAINWVLSKLGGGKIPTLHVAGFASGGHIRGPGSGTSDSIPAMLSDGEYVMRASSVRKYGTGFMHAINTGTLGGFADGGDVGSLTEDAIAGVFGTASKVGGIIKKGLSFLTGGLSDKFFKALGDFSQGAFNKIAGKLMGLVGGLAAKAPGGEAMKSIVMAVPKFLTKAVGKFLFDKMGLFGMGSNIGGSGVQRWLPVVLKALSLLGQPASFAPLVLKAIAKESGGNPNIVNNWDSNAKAGTPSGGLLQTIGPTFNAYAGPFRSLGMFNPLANIYAAINYAMHRYGAGWAARMAAPGGYAGGGLVGAPMIPFGSYDSGGYLPEGLSLAFNGTGRPEPVGHHLGGGGGVTVQFNAPVYAKSEREFREMVIEAVAEAKRRKRF